MAKVLNINDMLEAAWMMLDCGDMDQEQYDMLEAQATVAARNLAEALVKITGVKLLGVSHELGAAGLCADFVEGPDGEQSFILGSMDQGGEWS